MLTRSGSLLGIAAVCGGGLIAAVPALAQHCPGVREAAEKFIGGTNEVELHPSGRYETLTFVSDQGVPVVPPGDEVSYVSQAVSNAKLGTVLHDSWMRQFGTVLVLLNEGVAPEQLQHVAGPRLVVGGDRARQTGNPVFAAGNVDHIFVNQVIVQFHASAGPEDIRELLARFCARPVKQRELPGGSRYLLTFDGQTARHALAMVNRLNREKIVQFAQPDAIVIATDPTAKEGPATVPVNTCPAVPSSTGVDPYFPEQWHLQHLASTPGDPEPDINAPEAWAAGAKGNGILVAILDDAVETTHEDLAGQIQQTWNSFTESPALEITDLDKHGTAVAGIVGAVAANAHGVKGVAPQVKLMPIRVVKWITSERSLYPYSVVVQGLEAAIAAGARVINMSVSLGPVSYQNCDANGVCQGAVEAVLAAATGMPSTIYPPNPHPAVPVFPTGNEPPPVTIAFPATLASSMPVIAIGATDISDKVKVIAASVPGDWASTQGPEITVVAPGVGILTTDRMAAKGYCGGNYVSFNGTSAATPVAAGVVALMESQYVALGLPLPTPQQLKNRLQETAKHFVLTSNGDYVFQNDSGHGRVDACKALRMGSCPAPTSPPKTNLWLFLSVAILGTSLVAWWVKYIASKRAA